MTLALPALSASLRTRCTRPECCYVTALDAPFASQMQVQEILEPVMPAGTCRACLSLSSGSQEDYGIAQTAQRPTLHLAKEPTSLLQKLELTSLSPSIPFLV